MSLKTLRKRLKLSRHLNYDSCFKILWPVRIMGVAAIGFCSFYRGPLRGRGDVAAGARTRGCQLCA